MIQFEDIMKLKEGDTVVCCEKTPQIISYEPGELYVITAVLGDDMELRPIYEDKNFKFENVSYDDMYKHFTIPDENEFYIGDLGVLKYEDELHFIHIKNIQWIELWDFDNIHNQRKYKTGDKVYCETCPNLHDYTEIKNFGWIDKKDVIKIQHNIVDWKQIKIEPGMNILADEAGHQFFERLIQIEIPNGLKTSYVTTDSSGKVYRRKKTDLSIPRNLFEPGHKIISQNNTQFMITNVSEFNGYASVGEQYSYNVAGLNFHGDGQVELFEDIPELEMNDVYGYLKNLHKENK